MTAKFPSIVALKVKEVRQNEDIVVRVDELQYNDILRKDIANNEENELVTEPVNVYEDNGFPYVCDMSYASQLSKEMQNYDDIKGTLLIETPNKGDNEYVLADIDVDIRTTTKDYNFYQVYCVDGTQFWVPNNTMLRTEYGYKPIQEIDKTYKIAFKSKVIGSVYEYKDIKYVSEDLTYMDTLVNTDMYSIILHSKGKEFCLDNGVVICTDTYYRE